MNKHTSTDRLSRFAGRYRLGSRRPEAGRLTLLYLLMAASAVGIFEFALVLVDFHRAGEATHKAIRSAQANAPIAALGSLDVGPVVCGGGPGGVSCSGGAVVAPESFVAIVDSMRDVMPGIEPENVRVMYRASGHGGEASDAAVTPVVSIDVVDLTHPYRVLNVVPGLSAGFRFPRVTTSALVEGAATAGGVDDGF